MRIYADCRCLQDPSYARRGVGLHSTNLLRALQRGCPNQLEIIGLLDLHGGEIPEDLQNLAQRWSYNWNPVVDNRNLRKNPLHRDVFINLSPMTNDSGRAAVFLNSPDIFSIAIVYDFIPHDLPEIFLSNSQVHSDYQKCLAWLYLYDHFICISKWTESRLHEIIPIQKGQSSSSGVGIRADFLQRSTKVDTGKSLAELIPFSPHKYFVLSSGKCIRKNAPWTIAAVARLQQKYPDYGLVVIGRNDRSVLLEEANQLKLKANLVCLTNITDQEMQTVYRTALVAISPSRMEGFDLTVVEAVASHCPVLASDIPVHQELLENQEHRFALDDHDCLIQKLTHLIECPQDRHWIWVEQSKLVESYEETVVGDHLVDVIRRQRGKKSAVQVRKRNRPRLAFVTPFPPDRSGVATYTAQCLKTLSKYADIDVYTNAVDAKKPVWIQKIAPISDYPYICNEYDRVVSVLGNSDYHFPIIDRYIRYGGAVINHDNRMAEQYAWRYGLEAFAKRSEKILQRKVSLDEAQSWLANPDLLPFLFLEDYLPMGEPFIVHSQPLQKLIQKINHQQVDYLPFACQRTFPEEQLQPFYRQQMKMKLHLPEDKPIILSFGLVAQTKAPLSILWGLEILRSWGYDFHFYFVGKVAEPKLDTKLLKLMHKLKLTSCVHFIDSWISDEMYIDYLAAADLAIQLRVFGLGGLSGAVLDVIGAGIPTVVNDNLAEAMDSPDYILRIPDTISPICIAEALADAMEKKLYLSRFHPQRDQYLQIHNFDYYSKQLLRKLKCA